MRKAPVFIALLILWACGSGEMQQAEKKFDWQGHRGARGQAPENTVPGMRLALQSGVRTLEMDVVVTADEVVVLSHEPYLNSQICLDSNGQELADTGKLYNIYTLTFSDLQKFDCGTRPHPDFPGQEHYPAAKPSLEETILASEEMVLTTGREEVYYNVEVKSRPEWDGHFHPPVEAFVDAVVSVLRRARVLERTTLQSFDLRALRYAEKRYPELKLSLLLENGDPQQALQELGFLPAVFSCHHEMLNRARVKELQALGLEVIPWTVNDIGRAEELMGMGVDGIITDYPSRLIPALSEG